MPRKHIIEPAHGRTREARWGARLSTYERGEEESLTHRQLAIVFLASHGFRNPQIAEMLGISYQTVKTHWRNIYLRTGVYDPDNYNSKTARTRVVVKMLREGKIP